MKFKLRIDSKYILILFILLGFFIFFFTSNQVAELVNDNITQKLDSDNNLGYSLLEQKYPGDWSIIAGQLYKGQVLMNGNHELVDEVQKQTHSLATIFMGDTRIATTVLKNDGSRAEGTQAAPEVIDRVLKDGKEYHGKALVNTKMCRTKYIPLRDSNGKVIGMWFVGIPIDQINQEMKNINYLTGAFSILLIFIGIVIALYFNNSIVRPIRVIAKDLSQITGQVSAASASLSAASQQLSEGSAEQAASIEETSSTLEESVAMIQQTKENTKQAALLSKHVKELSDKGDLEMQELTDSMNELKKSSAQIAKIIKVIDEIAFQTNILALNAAIEAARAGESGAGFAVVAEEVRNLAQRSALAAKDTALIIESNIELSEKGMTVTETVKNSLMDITIQAKKVSELMEEITAASGEQSQGVEQVNQAILQMEGIVQQNTSSAEENAAAANELNNQSQNILEIVEQLSFILTGNGLKKANGRT
ncbi:MAG TPA: methyl-accepting chemotaxis protein [Bacillota bacterium]|nr:methyl-accepting chemotaxis protein [Bacillota bacterium]